MCVSASVFVLNVHSLGVFESLHSHYSTIKQTSVHLWHTVYCFLHCAVQKGLLKSLKRFFFVSFSSLFCMVNVTATAHHGLIV